MNGRLIALIALAAPLLALAGPWTGVAQISVSSGSTYNQLGIGTPLSDDMSNVGDLFIQFDIELGGELYLDADLFMERDTIGPFDEDQSLFFADGGANDLQFFGWDDSADGFVFSADLELADFSINSIQARDEGTIHVRSESPFMLFLIDSDADDDAGQVTHTFTWYNNNFDQTSRAMQLSSVPGDVGDLEIAGSLTQNGFDLAEMFWLGEFAEPGELVAVDDSRPDAVRPATSADGGRLLGIVATDPGIILGGGAFSVAALRERWGESVADEFESRRAELEAAVYSERRELQDEALRLTSPGAFAEFAARRLAESDAHPAGRQPSDGDEGEAWQPRRISDEQLQEAYEAALVQHETTLLDLTIDLFFDQHFARVALAGRVPVKVDASFGAIEIGDPLTASSIPGVARKAQEPGVVVGTALEPMPAGAGTILAFVDRDWFGGEARGRLASLEAEIGELRAALTALARSVPGATPELQAQSASDRSSPNRSEPRRGR